MTILVSMMRTMWFEMLKVPVFVLVSIDYRSRIIILGKFEEFLFRAEPGKLDQ